MAENYLPMARIMANEIPQKDKEGKITPIHNKIASQVIMAKPLHCLYSEF